jgi:hypothetical protein
MQRDVLIGIDASLVNCGVAVLENGTLQLYKGELFEAVDFIRGLGLKDRAVVVMEDPNRDAAVFGAWLLIKNTITTFLQKKGTLADVESMTRRQLKQAQNVGESKAAAKVLMILFERAGMPIVTVAPSDRHRADKDAIKSNAGVLALSMPTKTTAKQFEQFTGYTGRSNEHNRDAATLIWGKNMAWVKFMLAKQKK